MQSFLTYRKLGQVVRAQLQDQEQGRRQLAQSHNPPHTTQPTSRVTSEEEEAVKEGQEEVEKEEQEADDAEKMRSVPGENDPQPLQQTSTQIGYALNGINPRDRTTLEGKNGKVFVVTWDGEDDPFNPHNFSAFKKLRIINSVSLLAFAVTFASAVDSAVIPQAAEEFGVSQVVESLATANFLIAFGLGSLYAGPLSEIFGRNPVFIGSLVFFLGFTVGSALSPNIGAQLTFRFLAGFSGSPALTMSGGTIADIYSPLEKTYGFPVFAIPGFGGPILGPIVAAWIGPSPHISWRWTEWVSLILGGIVLLELFFFQPETFAPRLLKWKAEQLRKVTGDNRFRSETEIKDESLLSIVERNLARPFVLIKSELIIVLITIYFSIIYIIMFTFFVGYPSIFMEVYGVSQGITNTIFVAMLIGVFSASILVPIVWSITKKHVAKRKERGLEGIEPEQRLWFAMLGGSISMPISLFWMAWTDYASISIWSPIVASSLFGYGVICVFTSGYMYIIDSYEIYAASALTFVALVRYIAAGGMTVVGLPMYGNLGPHWTMTILGCLAALMAPIPYALYIWGPKVRKFSKYAVNKTA